MYFKSDIKNSLFGFAFLFAIIIINYNCYSQLEEGKPLDKIVAIVGNEIITQSDIEGSLLILQYQNPKLDINDPKLRDRILEELINKKLVITKAIEDSIQVSDEEVNQMLDAVIQQKVQQLGSEKRVEDVYGLSISRLKFEYKDEVRKELLAQKMQQQQFMNVTCSPKEVEEFYKDYSDSLPMIPAQVELYHIVKNVEASTAAESEIYQLAKRVRDSLLAGGDFSDFAKRYSNDPGTKDIGGELGWFAKGKLYPDFEKAAFNLQEGEISSPIKTPFGYHIIQTLEKRKDEIRTRHILFKIGQTTDDVEKTKTLLMDLKKRAEAGESFEELAKQYSDDKETKGFGGFIGKVPANELPSDAINKLPDGGITEPLLYQSDPTKTSYNIMFKKKTLPEHKPTLAEDYKQIENMALNYKRQNLFQKWMSELRKELYWEIVN